MAALALGAAAPAVALPNASQRGGPAPEQGNPAKAFAMCSLSLNEGTSRKVLRTAPGSDDEMKLLKYLAVRGCVRGKARDEGISSEALRGGLAEVLYLRDRGTQFNLAAHPETAAPAGTLSDVELNLAIASCTARIDPTSADGMVRAKPGSPEESSSLAALRTSLSKCVPGARQFRLTKPELRAMLAEALYLEIHNFAAPGRAPGSK